MEKIYWNENWLFSEKFTPDMLQADYDDGEMKKVRLPHTCREVPYHYFDEQEYQMVSAYRKHFRMEEAYREKQIFLTFEGSAHLTKVYLNGAEIGSHACGYTAFTVELTGKVYFDKENVLTVRVDSREDRNIPPFGFVIDYMTYGGIYRDVYLEVAEGGYIDDIFVMTKISGKDLKRGENEPSRAARSAVVANLRLAGVMTDSRVGIFYRRAGQEWKLLIDNVEATEETVLTLETGEIELWDTQFPTLYELKAVLFGEGGKVLDEKTVTYGYRKAVFRKDGFYLNGVKTRIRGLNRHQSYPYVGYAMPRSMQEYDAELCKYELGLNAVRTSHYPQSQYFLDRCDELGLMVFTEIPGWQHIGDGAWKEQAVENVRDMVLQNRNHPSIILWGVRINESVDDDAFYERTNEEAHRLDPTRQTGGVRCYKKSHLLEDVYTYNDFSHDGKTKGCEPKANVTSDPEKPYLITEYNGHMYPTKAFDWEEHRLEHALRHVRVLDDVAGQEDIAGSFGWCMFDYNTHKDFGSGDRICYHGVMDMFRNGKLAAAVYASQQEETPVLEVSSSFDIGEHPGCNRNETYIFTNADSVKMYKNGKLIKEYFAGESEFKNLRHGPLRIDDYVGDALRTGEGMKGQKEKDIKTLLNEAARVGLNGMDRSMYLKAGKVSLLYRMKQTDLTELYNKYVGDWGGTSTVYRFEGIKDGEVVSVVEKAPMKTRVLKTLVSHTRLIEKNSYDAALIRLRVEDENGNLLNYFNDALCLETEGPIEVIGPKVVSLSGGMGGVYVKTTGKPGAARLVARGEHMEPAVVGFVVVRE